MFTWYGIENSCQPNIIILCLLAVSPKFCLRFFTGFQVFCLKIENCSWKLLKIIFLCHCTWADFSVALWYFFVLFLCSSGSCALSASSSNFNSLVCLVDSHVGIWNRCSTDGQCTQHCGWPGSICYIPLFPLPMSYETWVMFLHPDEQFKVSLKIFGLSNVCTSDAFGNTDNVN